MDYRRDKIKGTIKNDEATSRLLDSALISTLVKLFEELMYDAGHDAAELAIILILNVGVFHMDGTNSEEFVS